MLSPLYGQSINNVALAEVKDACVSGGGVKREEVDKETAADKENEEMTQ